MLIMPVSIFVHSSAYSDSMSVLVFDVMSIFVNSSTDPDIRQFWIASLSSSSCRSVHTVLRILTFGHFELHQHHQLLTSLHKLTLRHRLMRLHSLRRPWFFSSAHFTSQAYFIPQAHITSQVHATPHPHHLVKRTSVTYLWHLYFMQWGWLYAIGRDIWVWDLLYVLARLISSHGLGEGSSAWCVNAAGVYSGRRFRESCCCCCCCCCCWIISFLIIFIVGPVDFPEPHVVNIHVAKFTCLSNT